MKLIIGLGNPGDTYAHTRHNIGWDAVTQLATTLETSFAEKSRFRAEVAEGRLGEEKVVLARPLTFMNLSGEAVQALMQFYKIELKNVLIVQDEMDYAPGQFAFCANGGPAGHNGVASFQSSLGTTAVSRLRVGIGRPVAPMAKEDFVLQAFSPEEKKLMAKTIGQAEQAMKDWCKDGVERAMNIWNKKSE